MDDEVPDISRLNEIDELGYFPLLEAVLAGSVEHVRSLLQNGADVNLYAESRIGDTAIFAAVRCEYDPATIHEMVELLCCYRADPRIRCWMHRGPIDAAWERFKSANDDSDARTSGYFEMILDRLMRAWSDCDYLDATGIWKGEAPDES